MKKINNNFSDTITSQFSREYEKILESFVNRLNIPKRGTYIFHLMSPEGAEYTVQEIVKKHNVFHSEIQRAYYQSYFLNKSVGDDVKERFVEFIKTLSGEKHMSPKVSIEDVVKFSDDVLSSISENVSYYDPRWYDKFKQLNDMLHNLTHSSVVDDTNV